MPECTGPELRELVQDCLHNPHIPTVLMSGYPDVFGDPGLSVLAKPFTTKALLRVVEQALTGDATAKKKPAAWVRSARSSELA